MRTTLTFKQWKRSLGEAITLADAAVVVGRSPVELARAAAMGKLRVHRFDAVDGRAFFMVQVEGLLDYQRRAAAPKPTPRMMQRAFERMLAAA